MVKVDISLWPAVGVVIIIRGRVSYSYYIAIYAVSKFDIFMVGAFGKAHFKH